MNAKQRALLTLDGIVNLILGSLLLFFPAGLAAWLGLPETRSYFYASILGAVLVGIGLALMLERYGASWGMRGLELHGAIAINLCGGGAVLVRMASAALDVSPRGRILLWAVGGLVVVIGLVEVAVEVWGEKR